MDRLATEAIIIHFDDLQTGRVPAQIKAQIPDVPWGSISGARNILAHDYRGARAELLWDMIDENLQAVLRRILDEL